jgi:ATP/ADP translocase
LVEIFSLLQRLFGLADIDEVILDVASLLNLEAIIADIAEGQVFGVILLLLEVVLGGLISIIRRVILLICHDVDRGHIDVVIRELSRLKFYGGVDVIIAKIF